MCQVAARYDEPGWLVGYLPDSLLSHTLSLSLSLCEMVVCGYERRHGMGSLQRGDPAQDLVLTFSSIYSHNNTLLCR